MEQEAAEELARGDGHAVAVLRGEADGVGGDGLEAVVGETHAVGVAAEVVEDLGGAAEGPLGMDDPLLVVELIEERAEGPRVGQVGDGPGELEFTALPGPRERGQELPAEEPGEHRDREEMAGARRDPPRPIDGQTPAGEETMDVGMELKVAGPGV